MTAACCTHWMVSQSVVQASNSFEAPGDWFGQGCPSSTPMKKLYAALNVTGLLQRFTTVTFSQPSCSNRLQDRRARAPGGRRQPMSRRRLEQKQLRIQAEDGRRWRQAGALHMMKLEFQRLAVKSGSHRCWPALVRAAAVATQAAKASTAAAVRKPPMLGAALRTILGTCGQHGGCERVARQRKSLKVRTPSLQRRSCPPAAAGHGWRGIRAAAGSATTPARSLRRFEAPSEPHLLGIRLSWT